MLDLIAIICLILSLIFAIFAIELPNLLYAAFSLCGMAITIGLLFGVLSAPYIMLFQLLVYAGATVSLFLAVIMLTKRQDP
ncbi:MAG: NADH-quinone oxidoreductase subunit J [Candidatus Bathyarchaeota archaeon]|jgi:NADH:ubiquinone oxidoreductase subunit 6 (subunit J)|nr:NADH-quinone oxidoreductase subunit J [Candidatus Bathyarchaeota archaeon]